MKFLITADSLEYASLSTITIDSLLCNGVSPSDIEVMAPLEYFNIYPKGIVLLDVGPYIERSINFRFNKFFYRYYRLTEVTGHYVQIDADSFIELGAFHKYFRVNDLSTIDIMMCVVENSPYPNLGVFSVPNCPWNILDKLTREKYYRLADQNWIVDNHIDYKDINSICHHISFENYYTNSERLGCMIHLYEKGRKLLLDCDIKKLDTIAESTKLCIIKHRDRMKGIYA